MTDFYNSFLTDQYRQPELKHLKPEMGFGWERLLDIVIGLVSIVMAVEGAQEGVERMSRGITGSDDTNDKDDENKDKGDDRNGQES